jgi:hypothetical protein
LSAGSLKPDVVAILHQLALPYESSLVRVPCGSESSTALAKNYAVSNFVTSSVLTANPNGFPQLSVDGYVWDLTNNNVDVVNFFDPYVLGVYPSVAKVTGGAASTVYGCSTFLNRDFSVVSGRLTLVTSPTPNPVFQPFLLEPVELIPVSTVVDSYGPYMPAFDTSAGRCIWIDASPSAITTVTVNLTTNANCSIGPDSFYCRLYRFRKGADAFNEDAPSYSGTFSPAGVSGTATATLAVIYSGYYYVALNGTITAATNVLTAVSPSISISTLCSVVSRYVINTNLHTAVYSANEVGIAYPREVQLLGAAALVSNVTAPIYADGVIYGSASTLNSTWTEYTSRSTEVLTNMQSRSSASNAWRDGMYGWVCPPKFAMRSCVERSLNGIYHTKCYVVDPTNDADERCLGFNQFRIASSVVAGVPASKTMVRFAIAYEFASSSQMYALSTSRILPSSLEDALYAASVMPRFTKNDIHNSAFGRAISKAGNWLLDAAKTALPYVSLASNVASIFGNVVGGGLSNVGRVASFIDSIPITEALM